MRKKLDTRFPAARIKKIMQADEDVGKIAMAVPLLVSKALELFLQDLCDRTYDITQKSGAKTLNSGHLKQCVQSFNVFDFLKEIVSRVPDLGGHDTGGEDHPVTKRRKIAGDEGNESEEDVKKNHVLDVAHSGSRGGRGRGRGRGRPRKIDTDSAMNRKYEDDPEINGFGEKKYEWQDSKENIIPIMKEAADSLAAPVRNFDLNLELDENGNMKETTTTTTTIIGAATKEESKVDEEYYPAGWYLTDVQKMAIIDPLQLASLNTRRIDEDEEDYDEDEEEG